MDSTLKIDPKCRPILDPGFSPASLWNRAYRSAVKSCGQGEPLTMALDRIDGSTTVFQTEVFPHREPWIGLNVRYAERLLKFLLWSRSGFRVALAGNGDLTRGLGKTYAPNGPRRFDFEVMGQKVHGRPLEFRYCSPDRVPAAREKTIPVAKSFEGCRIGFDLGGSNRKSAAVRDGHVLFVESVPWDPYVQKDPAWHRREILDCLRRAAAKLPRVDAVGGAAAGVYQNNQVCFSSLFRSVSDADFDKHARNMFVELADQWQNASLVVVNDGQLSALTGAMVMNATGVLGIAMGSCTAAGYVTTAGELTNWMNDLSFSPIDYRDDAPVDQWSGDRGCGVQYLSQQAVARLTPVAGLRFPQGMTESQQLRRVQDLMDHGDQRAADIYRTIGAYFGYAIAHYAEFYDIHKVLLMGGVTLGPSGAVIIDEAEHVLKEEFPELASAVRIHAPDEQTRTHGHAIAATCLPVLNPSTGGAK